MTLACEDGNSKLVEVVTVVDVDDEKQFTPYRLEYSFLKLWRAFYRARVRSLVMLVTN